MEDTEPRVLFLQRIEFVPIHDFVLCPVAVHKTDWDGQRFVGRVFGHAFERRDPDASREEDRGLGVVQDEVSNRAEDGDLVAGLQGGEGALVR